MSHEFRLADIGEGLEEAEIISWLVAVGDQVKRDQPLIEVMTDKSNAELPAPVSGRVVELGGAVGDMLNVGELIAIIEETVSEAAISKEPSSKQVIIQEPPEPDAGLHSPTTPALPRVGLPQELPTAAARPKASPATRREALERGIDLHAIVGSGPGGRILLADLDQAHRATGTASTPAAPTPRVPRMPPAAKGQLSPVDNDGPVTEPRPATQPVGVDASEPIRGVRRAIAQNMTKSWSDIPHIHAFLQADAEPMLKLRDSLRATERPAYTRLTPLSFFVAAVARALGEHPTANASLDMAADTITYHKDVNVGIAVAAPQGLVVPVLKGANRLDFQTLSLTIDQLIHRAREGSLDREHFVGGTVTVTNFGSLGGEQATPLIRPPESVILGLGAIAKRPFVIDDQVVARRTMHLVAGADHRLLDGDVVTALLSSVATSLADPIRLVI